MKKSQSVKKPKRKNSSRPRNITDHDIKVIVDILESWGDSKLTWEAVAEEAEKQIFWRYTRQTLSRFALIRDAFSLARKAHGFKGATTKKRSASAVQATKNDKVALLEAKLRNKEDAFDKLTHQLATIIYNAGLLGITEERLTRPMPTVDRDRVEM